MRLQDLEQFQTLAELQQFIIDKGEAKNKTEARAKASALVPKEAKFQSAILQYLKTAPGVMAWKDQAGLYQTQGVPDILAIKDGLFLGFEVKRPFFGELSAIQQSFHERIRAAGGRVYVVSYVSQVKAILENIEAGRD